MNGDGIFTISDVISWPGLAWEWVVWAFFLPGDYILFFLMTSGLRPIAVFFEISPGWYGGFFSGLLSGIVCLFIFLAVLGTISEMNEK